jgi:hypothetical protein
LLALSISTPVTLDLTALTGGEGDAAFTKVVLLDIRNLEAAGSGKTLTIGAEGSAGEWYDPIGTAAGAKLTVPPATGRQLYTLESAGYAVGTRKLLKLDPGANAVSVLVTIAGA